MAVSPPNSMFYFVLVLTGNELDARNSNGRKKDRLLPIYSEETGKWGKKGSENNIKML